MEPQLPRTDAGDFVSSTEEHKVISIHVQRLATFLASSVTAFQVITACRRCLWLVEYQQRGRRVIKFSFLVFLVSLSKRNKRPIQHIERHFIDGLKCLASRQLNASKFTTHQLERGKKYCKEISVGFFSSPFRARLTCSRRRSLTVGGTENRNRRRSCPGLGPSDFYILTFLGDYQNLYYFLAAKRTVDLSQFHNTDVLILL